MESSDINETGNGPGEVEESDSGDSIFFTQKPQTSKPNAATSPSLCSLWCKPLSPRFLESDSSSEDEDVPEKRKGHSRLPKYNFTFINRRKSQLLGKDESGHVTRNRAIHHRGVAGFFRCFGEMWSSDQRNKSFESTLPTVDADDEEITPITEDEKSDEEEVKIIDKRQFVYSLKPKITKSSQPWFKKAKTSKQTRPSISQRQFGTKKTSRATSNTLSNDRHLDNNDVTLIEVYESIMPNRVNLLNDSDTESQSILQNHPLDTRGRHRDATNNTIANRADKKLGNEHLNAPFSQESVDLFEDYVTEYASPHRHKDKTPRKTSHGNNLMTKSNGDAAEKRHDVICGLETTPKTKRNPPSCNLKKDIREELLSCANAEDDCEQKKKRKKNRADNEQNGTYSDSLQILEAGQFDNIPVVKRKHTKNQKAVVSESEDVCDLVNNDSSATDCITVQGDDSVSVRRRKKKRQVPFVAETVENVALHLSLSAEDHEHGLSTNDIESAETNRPLHETELGNKVKKKKNKTKRKENGERDDTGPNAKIRESENCDSTEVTQPPRDESDQMKKKKNKASRSVEKTAPEGVKERAILSPNGSECSARKTKDQKKKRQFCEGEESEMEDSAVNKKKNKKICLKDDDQTISTSSHVEMSPSSGRLEKSRRPKVKKRLYNPNETFMDSF